MQRKTTRFLKRIVLFCICFTAAIYVACFIGTCYGVEGLDYIAYYTTWTFGGELLMTGVLRLLGDKPKEATTDARNGLQK